MFNIPTDKIKGQQKINLDSLDWPKEFWVCQSCKDEYFSDYDTAMVLNDQYCILCHPKENDSLGG